jgi:hypothetical protein
MINGKQSQQNLIGCEEVTKEKVILEVDYSWMIKEK